MHFRYYFLRPKTAITAVLISYNNAWIIKLILVQSSNEHSEVILKVVPQCFFVFFFTCCPLILGSGQGSWHLINSRAQREI